MRARARVRYMRRSSFAEAFAFAFRENSAARAIFHSICKLRNDRAGETRYRETERSARALHDRSPIPIRLRNWIFMKKVQSHRRQPRGIRRSSREMRKEKGRIIFMRGLCDGDIRNFAGSLNERSEKCVKIMSRATHR